MRDTKAFIPNPFKVLPCLATALNGMPINNESTVVASIRRLTRRSNDAHRHGEIQKENHLGAPSQPRAIC
jgi:hypothetical protein